MPVHLFDQTNPPVALKNDQVDSLVVAIFGVLVFKLHMDDVASRRRSWIW
jgi:hypothetical protein